MKNYPVKRGSRYDKLMLNLVHDWTVEGFQVVDGGTDEELTKRTPDFAVGMMSGQLVHQYARAVVFTGKTKAGERPTLTNVEGETFTLPLANDSPSKLAIGFIKWMKLLSEEQDGLDEKILAENKMKAPRHSLPVEMLTDEEKSDPNSEGVGAKHKKE
jgi:hypothetical protein